MFTRGPELYRQINRQCQQDFDHLISSGLYDALTSKGLLVSHDPASLACAAEPDIAYRVIRPQRLPFISYPYEWCFEQLRDAALVTLEIQRAALSYGMALKDASSFNITFFDGRPLFLDTLSFQIYREGEPWVAYRQFCEHFLAPLALMAYRDRRLNRLLSSHIHGVPLDLAVKLLPLSAWTRIPLLLHLRMHASSQEKHAGRPPARPFARVSRNAMLGLIDSLHAAVRGLRASAGGEGWAQYYTDTNYDDEALESKKRIVREFLESLNPSTVWDLGSNTGVFSRIAAERGCRVCALDFDQEAVAAGYRHCRETGLRSVTSIWMDLTNPSPGLGWASRERDGLVARGPADTAMALALVHHLAISNNTPLPLIAAWFAQLCRTLIIEFIPKTDSQVQRLLATREDVFAGYSEESFEAAFFEYFHLVDRRGVEGSERTLYALRVKS